MQRQMRPPPCGVNRASRRRRRFGPATFDARAWSRSARRMLCATGSGRRSPVVAASAWRLRLRGLPSQIDDRGRASGPPVCVGANSCRQHGQQQRLELLQHSGVVVDFPKTLSGSERIPAECSDSSRICEKCQSLSTQRAVANGTWTILRNKQTSTRMCHWISRCATRRPRANTRARKGAALY